MMCSRCKENIATIFLTRMEGDRAVNDGICIKCAKELGIAPVNDIIKKMGLTDEDLDNISGELLNTFGTNGEEEDGEGGGNGEGSSTATFPFLDNLFSGIPMQGASEPSKKTEEKKKEAPEKKPKRKFLDGYGINLTVRAKEGKLDKTVGRAREITRMVQILNRRTKNNPCLIGEPGVGKTAIVEALAQHISDGDVPEKLLSKEIYLIDLTALVAGTQFRGQFESRMKSLVEEVKQAQNIILFIDEIHNLSAAGDAEGAMNAANILKPALSRGDIQLIGATTLKEYRKHIEKDTALERRFQPIMVDEPSVDDAVEILKGIKPAYEDYHGVSASDDVLRQTVVLSERYITDRFLPDKAIDLLDESMSEVNLNNKDIKERAIYKKSLESIENKRELLLASESQDTYQALADLRIEECKIHDALTALNQKGRPALTIDDLAKVIEVWTNIPQSKISQKEFVRLSGLAGRLKKRVVSQDEAIKAISNAISRNRTGVSPKRKPVSMIFAGSTGVGKTELVKQLALDLFDSPEALIRLDMSEYMEKHATSRIIGAPPGYVGYDEAGQITEKIRRRPYSVILFDEIEKAHPDVLNILLQILDDGRITDAQGRMVNFENTIIILTTNAGSNLSNTPAGFNKTTNVIAKEKVQNALKDFLRPEFLNRIDEIIVFDPLTKESFKEIAKIMLSDLQKSLEEKKLSLSWSDEALDYLTEKSFDRKYGARNLRRTIQTEVENKIASLLIENYEKEFETVEIIASDGELLINLK